MVGHHRALYTVRHRVIRSQKCVRHCGRNSMGNSLASEQAHAACESKNMYAFSSMLKDAPEGGEDILNIRGAHNMTPLMTASKMSDNHDLVIFLVAKGANLDSIDESGWTALHHAAAVGELDVIKVLLENGANRYIRNFFGLTPLDYFLDDKSLGLFRSFNGSAKEKGVDVDRGPSLLVPPFVVHKNLFEVEYAWGSSCSGAYMQVYTQSMKCLWKLIPRTGHFKYVPKHTSSRAGGGEDSTQSVGSVSFNSELLKVGRYYRILLHLSSSKAIAASKPFKVVAEDGKDLPDFDYEFNLEEEGVDDY